MSSNVKCSLLPTFKHFFPNTKLHPRGLVQPCLVALCKKSTRNQPFSNPRAGTPTVGWRLVLQKPTAFQPSYIVAYGWNDGWFRENQPRSNLRILKPMVGMTIPYTKTNRFPTFFDYSLWLDWLLVLRKPTVFQPSYRSADGWIDGWFCENQPHPNLRIIKPMVGMKVLRKPTVNPPVGGPIWGLDHGWFPVDFLHKPTGWNWVGWYLDKSARAFLWWEINQSP